MKNILKLFSLLIILTVVFTTSGCKKDRIQQQLNAYSPINT